MTVTTCVKAIAVHWDLDCPRATSAPGLGLPLPHLHLDWAHPCHICTGIGIPQEPRNCRGSVHLYKAPHKARRIGPAFPAVACQSLPSDSLPDFESPSPRAYATAYVEYAKPPRATLPWLVGEPVDTLSRFCEVADLGHALVGGCSCRRCSTLRCADCAANRAVTDMRTHHFSIAR